MQHRESQKGAVRIMTANQDHEGDGYARWRRTDGSVAVGIVTNGLAHELPSAALPPLIRTTLHASATEVYESVALPIPELNLLAPVVPGKIICVGLNYRDHAQETNVAIPDVPLLFAKFPSSVTGPRSDIHLLPETTSLDYEAELAVVVGKPGRRIPAADAFDHLVGAMAANDVSARDAQFSDGQWVRGKSFDTFAPMGPLLIPLTPAVDLTNLGVRSWVNGEARQESNTRNLIFDVAHLVEYVSTYFTLETGDVILTGTPGGVGLGFDPPKYLRIGDTVEVEVEGLGRLSNRVVEAPHDAGFSRVSGAVTAEVGGARVHD
jgi:2,4-diketo-3-deoxy-L-fuconate hydrolase